MDMMRNPGRLAGLLYLLTSIVGFFAMIYVPEKLIVHGDAGATAVRIVAHEALFRMGIAAQLVSEAGFIFVALALYALLKGVNRRQALLMVLLIVIAIPIAFANELNAFAVLELVRGSDFLGAVEKPQRDALAMVFLRLHHHGFIVAELFSGLWLFPLAVLVYRSRFLPRFLGVWLGLAGVGWVALFLQGVLWPEFGNLYNYSQPALLGEMVFAFWLVIVGAKPPGVNADSGRYAA